MHFGGIRKPRTYSNLNMAGMKGWLLPLASDVGEGGGINFNFSVPECREWYAQTHAHFINDGMDFWWNDEGETSWFTYAKKSMTHPLRFWYNWRTLMVVPSTPLRKGVGTPHQCPLGVGSKLPLLLDADVHTF